MAIARITSGTSGRRVFDVWSFDNYTMDLDMPIEVFAIPEEDAENAQLIKAQGNISTVTLSWTLAQPPRITAEQAAVWPSRVVNGETYIDLANGTNNTSTHSWGVEYQRAYLRQNFQRSTIGDLTDTIEILEVENEDGSPKRPTSIVPRDFERGALNKILLTRDSQEPVNIRGTVSMFIGQAIAG